MSGSRTTQAPADRLPASPYRRILFCTDFSATADHAFTYALDAAVRRPGSVLYLLHVIPEPEAQFWKTYLYEVDGIDDKARQDIDAKIAADYLPRVPAGQAFEVAVRIGKEYVQILDFARASHVDAIIMGRSGKTSAVGKIFFGNVIERVVRHADCPVLVVPEAPGGEA